MGQLLAFVLSLAATALLKWAGLHYDRALFDGGVILTVFVVVAWAWLWAWKRTPKFGVEPVPEGQKRADPNARALRSINEARGEAAYAASDCNADHEGAFHTLEAAMLTVAKQFGIKMLNFRRENALASEPSYMDRLKVYVPYIDCFYPMLKEGHIEAARAKADDFRLQRGC